MKQNLPFLKHILDEINFLLNQTDRFTYEYFITDELSKRASARSFEVPDEAIKSISHKFKNEHKDIDFIKNYCYV